MATFDVQLVGFTQLILRFQDASQNLMARVGAAISEQTDLLQGTISEKIGTLFNTPEKMQASLSSTFTSTPTSATGTVTADGLPYLKIQEYGGTVQTPEWTWTPGDKVRFVQPHGLNFFSSFSPETTAAIFTKHTDAHSTTLPERSYMRATLAARRAEIVAAIAEAAKV